MDISISNQALLYAAEKGFTVVNGEVFYKNRKKKLQRIHTGYFVFAVRYRGMMRIILVSRFVAYQKFGMKIFEEGLEVRHLDSNLENNFPDNIALGTRQQNMLDKSKEKRMNAALIATAAITKYKHEDVLKLHNEGHSYKQIMDKLGILSKGTVSWIIHKSVASQSMV